MWWIPKTENPSGPQLQTPAYGSKDGNPNQTVPHCIRHRLTGQIQGIAHTEYRQSQCSPYRRHRCHPKFFGHVLWKTAFKRDHDHPSFCPLCSDSATVSVLYKPFLYSVDWHQAVEEMQTPCHDRGPVRKTSEVICMVQLPELSEFPFVFWTTS